MLEIPNPLSASQAAKTRNPKPRRRWFPTEFLDVAARTGLLLGEILIGRSRDGPAAISS